MNAARSVAAFCVMGLTGLAAVSSAQLLQEEKAEAKSHTVTMKSISFEPKKLVVQVGDSVVWSNAAFTSHTATSDDEGQTFDTGEVESEKTSPAVTFAKVGEVGYHCKIYGKAMRGTIIVKAADQWTSGSRVRARGVALPGPGPQPATFLCGGERP